MPRKLRDKRFIRSTGGRGAELSLREERDDAIRLLTEIKERRLDPRDLSKRQRQACLLILANGKQTSPEMAALLCVSPQLVRKDLQELRRALGREVAEWTTEEVLGQVAMAKEKCATLAYRQEDPALAWSIERDWARLLKELGVIGQSEQEGVRVTIEALGAGYERAREVLGRALDPRLTGRVVEEEPPVLELPLSRSLDGSWAPEPLPVPVKVPDPPPSDERPRVPRPRRA